MHLALYKGPPHNDWFHTVSHYAIRLWTWSRWSHGELVINGVCWSSSARDHGVRGKVIDLTTGRWDVLPLDHLPQYQQDAALDWFRQNAGQRYDYRNIVRFILPFIGHNRRQRVCFEAIAESLGLAGAHKLTANDLHQWAKSSRAAIIGSVGS